MILKKDMLGKILKKTISKGSEKKVYAQQPGTDDFEKKNYKRGSRARFIVETTLCIYTNSSIESTNMLVANLKPLYWAL